MKHRGIAGVLAAGIVIVLACGQTTGPGPNGKGICTTSCPKQCDKDQDCPNGSQLCCDYGGKFGKACVSPQQCPRFCTDDSKCRTDQGEACCAANPASSEKICAPANTCRKTCANDNDCAGGTTPKCCTAYARPICTATAACPTTCAQSTDCNTMSGQTCCTSVKGLDKNMLLAGNVGGLCVNQGSTCPKACTQSTDCDTTRGELCCNGFCSTSCQKECDSSNECPTDKGQLCCRNAAIASPFWNFTPQPPPPPPPPPPPCGIATKCTRTSDCTNGGICCSLPIMMDGGVMDSGVMDSGGPMDSGMDGSSEGGITDAGTMMDASGPPPMCGTMCGYTCMSQSACIAQKGIVCN